MYDGLERVCQNAQGSMSSILTDEEEVGVEDNVLKLSANY
jgi:hypothetical protein